MATVLRVKHSQNEMKTSAFLFQNTYFVDDSISNGMKLGWFSGLNAEGLSQNKPACTLIYAGANATAPVKASGVIYEASKRYQYESVANWNNEFHLHPRSFREEEAIGLLKSGVLELANTEGKHLRSFYSVNTIVTSVETLFPGQIVDVDGTEFHVTGRNRHITTGVVSLTVLNAATGTPQVWTSVPAAPAVVTALGMMDRPVYLAPITAGTPAAVASEVESLHLPFVTFPTGQVVGYIESPISVRIDLRCDPVPVFGVAEGDSFVMPPSAEQLALSVAYRTNAYNPTPMNYV